MPPLISDWCDCTPTMVSVSKRLHVFAEKQNGRVACQDRLTATMASHYEDPKFLIDRFKRLGLAKAAKALSVRLPKTKKARSGHVGEILATETVNSILPTFQTPIKRLRWLDGREMALRGEDVIAIEVSRNSVRFLKGESKSRANLTPAVVAQARKALNANNGRPSQHAMGFMMDRLLEMGQPDLAYRFEEYMLKDSIPARQLVHMTFGLAGNNASAAFLADLNNYPNRIEQHAVMIRITDHQAFIKAAYELLDKYVP